MSIARSSALRSRIRANRRGFTMVEVVLSIGISTFIMLGVASLMLISGRAIKELYGETRTRSSRVRAIDQIRYRLANAVIGSITEYEAEYDPDSGVLIGYHRLEFLDANQGGSLSVFSFDPSDNTLTYDVNIDDMVDGVPVTVGPINVTFELEALEMIVVKVKTASSNRYGGDLDTQDGVTKVYLRNLPEGS